jgi:nicotinate-nucleotide adenylyltransferase
VSDVALNLPPRPRVGIFGGTFDPPHVGHLVCAVNVRHALALDVVLLVVANEPWQKEGSRIISPAEDRYALVRAAVGEVDGVEASRIELDRNGPSYTADTLRDLQKAIPDAQFFTILGRDAAAGLPTWERFEEVVAGSRLVVVDRPGASAPLPTGMGWLRVEVPHLDVSSTDLRARVLDGRPLDYLLTPSVIAEVTSRHLYESAR